MTALKLLEKVFVCLLMENVHVCVSTYAYVMTTLHCKYRREYQGWQAAAT